MESSNGNASTRDLWTSDKSPTTYQEEASQSVFIAESVHFLPSLDGALTCVPQLWAAEEAGHHHAMHQRALFVSPTPLIVPNFWPGFVFHV